MATDSQPQYMALLYAKLNNKALFFFAGFFIKSPSVILWLTNKRPKPVNLLREHWFMAAVLGEWRSEKGLEIACSECISFPPGGTLIKAFIERLPIKESFIEQASISLLRLPGFWAISVFLAAGPDPPAGRPYQPSTSLKLTPVVTKETKGWLGLVPSQLTRSLNQNLPVATILA